MLETCVLTVRSEMPSSSAIRLFAKPRACAITSPVLSPARTRSGTPLRSSARWISIAHRTARRALENASMNLSPSRSTSTPPVRSSAWRTSRSCSRKSSRARSSPSRSTSGVEFSMSVKTTVTVPSGRPCSPPCTRRRTRRVASVQSTGSPRWTLRIACAISSGLVSLVRKPDAPAARVGRTWSSSLNVESASTFTSGERSRSSSVALMPSTSGMTTSMTTTSGRSSCARSTAAAPFSASPTTSTSGCTSRNSRSPCRTTAWSSAIRTRMVSVKIDLHVDCRAGARRGAHLERAADRLRALPHRDQPEPPPRLRAFGVEARAVVLDGDDQPAAARPQPHAHVLRARVLERVRERLLDDAKDFALVLDTRLATAVDVELDVRAVDAPQDVDVLLERRREPVRGDVRRPELEDERAHLGHRAADELAHLPELLLRLLRLGLDEERGGVGGQRDAEESLVHGVVELAREAVSLLDHRQLAAALVEPRVLDRDRGVGGEGLDQRLVGLVEDGAPVALLVREVEGADHLALGDDRDAEEGAHARVGVGPALEAWMLLDVREALAPRRFEHGAEEAVLAREVADRVVLLLAHPRGDEVREAALAVGDADRRVARGGQLPRRVGELLEHGLEAVLGRDRDDGVADRAEGAAIERLWHGSSRYAARGGCGRAARALSGTVVSRPSGFDRAPGESVIVLACKAAHADRADAATVLEGRDAAEEEGEERVEAGALDRVVAHLRGECLRRRGIASRRGVCLALRIQARIRRGAVHRRGGHELAVRVGDEDGDRLWRLLHDPRHDRLCLREPHRDDCKPASASASSNPPTPSTAPTAVVASAPAAFASRAARSSGQPARRP